MDYDPAAGQERSPAVSNLRFFVGRARPLLAVETMEARRSVVVYRQWKDNAWEPALAAAHAQRASGFGLPVGQDPAGVPVWVLEHSAEATAARRWYFVQTDARGFRLQPLPQARGAVSMNLNLGVQRDGRRDLYQTPHVTWSSDGEPRIAVSGLNIMTRDPKRPDLNRVFVALWKRSGGKDWSNVGPAGEPAHSRRILGTLDTIDAAWGVLTPCSEALLLWTARCPVRGPRSLRAARRPPNPATTRPADGPPPAPNRRPTGTSPAGFRGFGAGRP